MEFKYSFNDGLCPHCEYRRSCKMIDESKVTACPSFNVDSDAYAERCKKVFIESKRDEN